VITLYSTVRLTVIHVCTIAAKPRQQRDDYGYIWQSRGSMACVTSYTNNPSPQFCKVPAKEHNIQAPFPRTITSSGEAEELITFRNCSKRTTIPAALRLGKGRGIASPVRVRVQSKTCKRVRDSRVLIQGAGEVFTIDDVLSKAYKTPQPGARDDLENRKQI